MIAAQNLAALCALALLGAPALAWADDAARTHDGFYLRLGLGPGYLNDTGKLSLAGTNFDFSVKGSGLVNEILLGGTPAPGLVIGGGFQSASFRHPTVRLGDLSSDANQAVLVGSIGGFLDYYPDPIDGLHFQGFLGFATLSSQDRQGRSSTRNPAGLALSAGLGYEWFVSRDWSIGVLGRVQYVRAKLSEADLEETDSVLVPGLLASFTYH